MARRDAIEAGLLATVRSLFRRMLRAARTAYTGGADPAVEPVRVAARRVWADAAPALEEAVADAVVEASVDVTGGHKLGNVDADAAEWAREVTPILAGEPDAVADRVGTAVSEGIDAGDTPQELQQRVGAVLAEDAWTPRVEMIARTQTTAAMGYGASVAHTAAQTVLDAPLTQRWIATKDARTRDTHRAADGQTRPVGEPFRVGEAELLFPAAPDGPPEEVINCRCTTAVDLPEIDWDEVERRRQAMNQRTAAEVIALAADVPEDTITAYAAPRVRSMLRLAHAVERGFFWPDETGSRAGLVRSRVAGVHPLWAGQMVLADALPSMTQGQADALASMLALDDPDVDALVALLPPKLLEYWTTGEGAAKIRWGTDGDWTRCNRYLAKYTPNSEGACATLHKMVTGVWPGDRRNATANTRPDDLCPCDYPDMVAALIAAWSHDAIAADDTSADDEASPPELIRAVTDSARALIADAKKLMRLAGVDNADELGERVERSNDRENAAAWRELDAEILGGFRVDRGGIRYPPPVTAGASGAADLPLASRDREWDGPGAAKRVATWADGDAAKLGRAFFWKDPDGDPTTQAAYKLGFADVIDGTLTAVPRGVFAAAAAVEGSRGGVDIPASDVAGVRSKIAGYYRKIAKAEGDDTIRPPWTEDNRSAAVWEFDRGTVTHDGLRRELGLRADDGEPDGGMIALVPSEADAQRIAIDGGLAPDDLHITMLYLGDADAWDETAQAELHELIGRVAGGGSFEARLFGLAAFNTTGDNPALVYIVGDDSGTLDAWHSTMYGAPDAGRDVQAMQHSPWVAHLTAGYGVTDTSLLTHADETITVDRLRVAFGGDVTDYPLDAVTVPDDDPYLDDTDGDGVPESIPQQISDTAPVLASADELAGLIAATIPPAALRTEVADMTMPDTEVPDVSEDRDDGWRAMALDHLDQLRALIESGEADGDNMDDMSETARGLEMVASEHTGLDLYTKAGEGLVADASIIADAVKNAPPNPPAEWFKQAKLPGLTRMTVNAEGRVWGHMAPWNTPHEGIPNEFVPAPKSSLDYAAFHRSELATADGEPVKVGYLLAGCGHARLNMTMEEAARYHEQACTQVAAVRAYEDEHGIQVVGSLLPGLSVEQANGITKLSGEWRVVQLEMMAAVGVDRAGYPVAPQNATELATADGAPQVLAASAVSGGQPPAEWVQAVADEVAARQAREAKRHGSVAAVTAARKNAIVREHDRKTREGATHRG